MSRRLKGERIPDLSGNVIDDGRIAILDLLGQGSFSKVFRALDNSDPAKPRFFAVKCLWRTAMDIKNTRLQLRELSLHKLVSPHPHIVTIHKVISDSYFIYVIMDLAQTCLFDLVVDPHSPFIDNDSLIKETFIGILDALAFCHANGIYHRDLKPENIMCSQNGTHPMIADFGLATTSTSSREFGCGTRTYFSPECSDYRQYEQGYEHAPNDVWMLGVILVNMVTGRHPWKVASDGDECYGYYMSSQDWLYNVFPISFEAHDIFNAIFDPNPSTRIKLPELRQRVLKVDTLFRAPTPPCGVRSFSAMTTDYETSSSGLHTYGTISSSTPVHIIAPASLSIYAASTRVCEITDGHSESELVDRSQDHASEFRLSIDELFANSASENDEYRVNEDSVATVPDSTFNPFVKLFQFKSAFKKLVFKV